MANQPTRAEEIENDFQNATEHLDHLSKLQAATTEYGDDQTVYTWSRSRAGENLTTSIPTGRGPSTLTVEGISRPFRRSLLAFGLVSPVESDVTITINTPESSLPAVDLRAGAISLGALATGQFKEFARSAGLLHSATIMQRLGRAIVRRLEPWLGSFEKLTAHGGQSYIGPYGF